MKRRNFLKISATALMIPGLAALPEESKDKKGNLANFKKDDLINWKSSDHHPSGPFKVIEQIKDGMWQDFYRVFDLRNSDKPLITGDPRMIRLYVASSRMTVDRMIASAYPDTGKKANRSPQDLNRLELVDLSRLELVELRMWTNDIDTVIATGEEDARRLVADMYLGETWERVFGDDQIWGKYNGYKGGKDCVIYHEDDLTGDGWYQIDNDKEFTLYEDDGTTKKQTAREWIKECDYGYFACSEF